MNDEEILKKYEKGLNTEYWTTNEVLNLMAQARKDERLEMVEQEVLDLALDENRELKAQLADMQSKLRNSQAKLTKAKKELENEKKRLIWYMNTKNRGYDFGGCTFNCGIDGRCSGHQKEYEVKAQARQQAIDAIFDAFKKEADDAWKEARPLTIERIRKIIEKAKHTGAIK